jgi:hypothetical protein
MNVAAWLHGLGLGQYEQAFRENDIDAEVLAHLAADDLIGLAVQIKSVISAGQILPIDNDMRRTPDFCKSGRSAMGSIASFGTCADHFRSTSISRLL